jgi:hypothetical protein
MLSNVGRIFCDFAPLYKNTLFSRPMSHSICIFGPRDVRGIEPWKNDVLATEQEQLSLVEILP